MMYSSEVGEIGHDKSFCPLGDVAPFGEHNSFGGDVWFSSLAFRQRVEGTLEKNICCLE